MRTTCLLTLAACLVAAPVAARARQAAEEAVFKPGNGVSAPVVVKDVKPQYTADAMRAGVQGTVTLDCVVQPDGTVAKVRVTKGLDPGLDQEAIKAVRQWRFKAGRKDGKPVAVRVALEMTFTLRDTPARPMFPGRPLAVSGAGGAGQLEAGPVYEPGAGVSAPVVVKEVRPRYTSDAKEARIQGVVALECVVGTDGSISDVKVTRSLDAGLDREAIRAVKQWRFEPGTKNGKAVPVRVALEMTFTLR